MFPIIFFLAILNASFTTKPLKVLLSTNDLKGMTWFITGEEGRVDTTTSTLHKDSIS